MKAFPRGLGELRHLEGLQADGCPLATPYSNLYSKDPLLLVGLHDRERLSLDLSDCGLNEVPRDVLLQTQLTSLNLGKNNIQVGATEPLHSKLLPPPSQSVAQSSVIYSVEVVSVQHHVQHCWANLIRS